MNAREQERTSREAARKEREAADREAVIAVLKLFCGSFDVVDKPSLYLVVAGVSKERGYPLSRRAARKAMESLYVSDEVVFGMLNSPRTHERIARIVKK